MTIPTTNNNKGRKMVTDSVKDNMIVFYLNGTMPANAEIDRLEKQIADNEEKILAVQKASGAENQSDISHQLLILKRKLDEFALEDHYADNLTFQISEAANKLKVKNFSTTTWPLKSGKTDGTEVKVYQGSIRAQFEASFEQFSVFINTLERHNPTVFVDTFSISATDDEKPECPVNMELNYYIFKNQNQSNQDRM